MTHALDLPAYLHRIGWTPAEPIQANLPTLRALQRAHAQTIAFENLDPWLGREVALDLTALQAKLVTGKRGGYCYEHNLLLGAVLRALGYAVTDLAARVVWNLPPGQTERPRTHMLLKVRADGADWLVDAGFGGFTLTAPLRLRERGTQLTAQAPCRLVAEVAEPTLERLEVQWQGEWQPLYSFSHERQRLADYAMSSWYLCHHPDSMFRLALMAARPLADGSRWTLRERRLTLHRPDGVAEPRHLETPAALRRALSEIFGLRLDDLPGLDERLALLCASPATSPGQ
jgi:N-hydroxyarylamine O-acetyltransferase